MGFPFIWFSVLGNIQKLDKVSASSCCLIVVSMLWPIYVDFLGFDHIGSGFVCKTCKSTHAILGTP